jgi:hypothetical protein
MHIDDDEIMVSFDVVLLFTAIPVDKAWEHIRNKLTKDKTLKQIIHSKPKVSQRIIKILEGNREITDPTAITNVFNNFFANIGNSLAS